MMYMCVATYTRSVLIAIESEDELFTKWIEVCILGLPTGDDVIIILHHL